MKNTYFMPKKVINERQFSDLIYKMVNESLDALSGYNFEANDNANDNNAQNDDSKRRNNRRRQQVEAFFKQPGVNPAAYAYRLYRVKPVEGDDTNDMKNARSKFMKCLNHEKNEDGYEYAFDSSEVNTLFSMISGNELKENKISLSESDIMYMVNESVKKILKEWQTDPDTGTDEFWSEMDPNRRTRTLKDIESDESWDEFDDENGFVPSVGLANAGTRKNQTGQDVDDALSIRNGEKYWNKRELANRDKMMSKYIDGSRDEDDIDDAWFGIHS